MKARTDDKGWPLVHERDDGIRPAGPPDRCFYCDRKVGEPHEEKCAVVTKKVRIRYEVVIDTMVPHWWDETNLLFHRNEGTWCSDNLIDEMERQPERCLCERVTAKEMEVIDCTPHREVQMIEHTQANDAIRDGLQAQPIGHDWATINGRHQCGRCGLDAQTYNLFPVENRYCQGKERT